MDLIPTLPTLLIAAKIDATRAAADSRLAAENKTRDNFLFTKERTKKSLQKICEINNFFFNVEFQKNGILARS